MTYPPELKATVMAALLTGQSVNSVAREYKIPKGTVSSWKTRTDLQTNADNAADAAVVATQKREIGDILLGYLKDSLLTLRNQLKVFGDEEWLRQQPASEAAILHGVIADKSIRLLEALSANIESENVQAVSDPGDA